jgi:excisionase family DNA binding protein
MSDKQLLKPTDVARRAQISTKSVLRAIKSGRLRASRLGERGAYRIKEVDYDAWIEESIVEPEVREPIGEPVPVRVLPPGAGRLVVTPEMGRPAA